MVYKTPTPLYDCSYAKDTSRDVAYCEVYKVRILKICGTQKELPENGNPILIYGFAAKIIIHARGRQAKINNRKVTSIVSIYTWEVQPSLGCDHATSLKVTSSHYKDL